MALQIGRIHHNESFSIPRTLDAKSDKTATTQDAVDVLSQLHSNIAQLEDLHGRLRFMMNEVEKLVRRR